MSSVSNVNTYLGSNPLGMKVRALEREVAELRKMIEDMKKDGAGSGGAAVMGPTGPPGPPGPAGPPGPMAYIAMPPSAMVAPAATAAPEAPAS